MEKMKLIFLIIISVSVHLIYSQAVNRNNDGMNINIENIRNSIDSLDKIIKVYVEENIDEEYIKDFKIERQIHQISIDTLIKKKIAEITCSSDQFSSFRDQHLDSTYFVGYLDPKDPDTSQFIWILPKKGRASNIETGRKVYGFANMHNRKSKLEIDFELFDRIGIYSMFPEVYGSIEMIFSENKTMRERETYDRLIKQAHKYNTKVDLVLSYYNWDTLLNLKPRIDQDAVMLNMVDSVSSIVSKYNFDGVTFDFDISRMNLRDVLFYKKLIYLVNKEIKNVKKNKIVNIIISLNDIEDKKTYSLVQIDSAYMLNSKVNKNNLNKDIKTNTQFNRLDLLLKPDLKEYIDNILISINKDDMNLKLITDTLKNRYAISNNSKVSVIFSLYSNLFKSNGKLENRVGSILQKRFNIKDFNVNRNKCYLAIDSSYYTHDLSAEYLKDKMLKIFSNSMGIALWHIEYGDTSFYNMLHRLKYEILNKSNSPRSIVIKHLQEFRAFVDSYRISIGIVLSVFLFSYVSFIGFAKIAGREKIIKMYKNYFLISGVIMLFLNYLYIITIPFKVNNKLEVAFMSILIVIIFIIAGYYLYKLNKAKDLP